MSLLQILEPGSAAETPVARRRAVGIDLGTTHSLVATIEADGSSRILLDANGGALLPSVVCVLPDGQVQVGRPAQALAGVHPQTTFRSIKRFMGRGAVDISEAGTLPYAIVPGEGTVRFQSARGPLSPVEISAEILKVLRQRAEEALGGSVEGAVITVPAYFDDAQRQATRDAARLAGIEVLRLLNEPTAAAVAYGLDNASEGVYAIYDLGGGTFDLSILRLRQGVFEVLATAGNTALGGDDFDRRLAEWFISQMGLTPNAAGFGELLTQARQIKEALSATEALEIALDTGADAPVVHRITRAQFGEMTADLVDKTLRLTRRALRDAGFTPDQVDGVVLVGGASRMPQVRAAVAECFGRPPLTDLDPDQVVALGAARQADVLAGNRRDGDDWLLLDVIPLSLGIETMGGLVEKIIPRNSTIPIARAQDFTTFKDGQGAMSVHVLQGERDLAADCRSLARFELHGIPPMAAGAARIQVMFQVDADGLVSVSATEQTTGVAAQVTVKPSYGLSDEEITRMLADSLAHAGDDAAARILVEQKVEAERLVEATRAALNTDGAALLTDAEVAALLQALHGMEQAITGHDGSAISAAKAMLEPLTDAFAARRMDHNIRTALAGRQVGELGG
ncbi:MAG: Fe-S protein assembly chaperone HscA [Pseudomonadota bacterium]|nr:Fe-S protein assembly chaperone HscA [Pseudomonadota bacterium]